MLTPSLVLHLLLLITWLHFSEAQKCDKNNKSVDASAYVYGKSYAYRNVQYSPRFCREQ